MNEYCAKKIIIIIHCNISKDKKLTMVVFFEFQNLRKQTNSYEDFIQHMKTNIYKKF